MRNLHAVTSATIHTIQPAPCAHDMYSLQQGVVHVGEGDPMPIRVQACAQDGLDYLSIIGTPGGTDVQPLVRHLVETVMGGWPGRRRLTVNLSPAVVPKSCRASLLAVMLAVAEAMGVVPVGAYADTLAVGTVGDDGVLYAPAGADVPGWAGVGAGVRRVLVPADAVGLDLVDVPVPVVRVRTLSDVLNVGRVASALSAGVFARTA